MDQRPLRLGDIVDDYCTRERRITNHVIVVMGADDIQQTRCTACDTEHAYKHAKVPSRKKKDEHGALYDEVLNGVLKPKRAPVVEAIAEPAAAVQTHVAAAVAVAEPEAPAPVAAVEEPVVFAAVAAPVVEALAESEPMIDAPRDEPEPAAFGWGHRQLIRAQLPKLEGQPAAAARPLPDFTMRQSRHGHHNGQGGRRHGHNNHFRGHGNGGNGNGNGNSGRGGRRH